MYEDFESVDYVMRVECDFDIYLKFIEKIVKLRIF